MEEIHYRHEWKHELNYLDLLTIRQRLQAIMEPDPHAVGGKYLIRSLYFDNPDDKALREKVDGVNMREKFRIRLYNGDASMIRLEKKSKRSGLCQKVSVSFLDHGDDIADADPVHRLIAGDHSEKNMNGFLGNPQMLRLALDLQLVSAQGDVHGAFLLDHGDVPVVQAEKRDVRVHGIRSQHDFTGVCQIQQTFPSECMFQSHIYDTSFWLFVNFLCLPALVFPAFQPF